MVTTRDTARYIISVESACLFVCMSVYQTINFESYDVESDRVVKFSVALGFRIWLIEWYDRHLCHVTEVTTRN